VSDAPERCSRCLAVLERGSGREAGWNARYLNGRLVELRCPDCQSAEEVLEAQQNAWERPWIADALEGRLVTKEMLRALSRSAAGRGSPSTDDSYFDACPGSIFAGVPCAELPGELLALFIVAPDERPEAVRWPDGEVVPRYELLDTEGSGAGAIFVSVELADWLALPRAVVGPTSLRDGALTLLAEAGLLAGG